MITEEAHFYADDPAPRRRAICPNNGAPGSMSLAPSSRRARLGWCLASESQPPRSRTAFGRWEELNPDEGRDEVFARWRNS